VSISNEGEPQNISTITEPTVYESRLDYPDISFSYHFSPTPTHVPSIVNTITNASESTTTANTAVSSDIAIIEEIQPQSVTAQIPTIDVVNSQGSYSSTTTQTTLPISIESHHPIVASDVVMTTSETLLQTPVSPVVIIDRNLLMNAIESVMDEFDIPPEFSLSDETDSNPMQLIKNRRFNQRSYHEFFTLVLYVVTVVSVSIPGEAYHCLFREQYESEKLLEEEWRRFESDASISMELAQKIWNKTVQRTQIAQVFNIRNKTTKWRLTYDS